MKNIIYQYYDGIVNGCVRYSAERFKAYADKIGADYLFEDNPKYVTNLGQYSPHYGAFKPVYTDSFHEYDNVLFVDGDIFPVSDLEENIFDEFDTEIGICEEWHAPDSRKKYNVAGINNANDEKWVNLVESRWNVKMPRTKSGLPKVFNSGMVLYSNDGLKKARERFIPFNEYVSWIRRNGFPAFYTCDQPYLHAMLEVCEFNWKIMDYKWNSSVHFVPGTSDPRPVIDFRDNKADFVHIQLRGKNNFDNDKIDRIVNLPTSMWNL